MSWLVLGGFIVGFLVRDAVGRVTSACEECGEITKDVRDICSVCWDVQGEPEAKND